MKFNITLPQFVFAICLFVSISLCVAGFILPPQGVIDGSVLTAVGELLGFATIAQLPLLLKQHNVEITHGDTKVSVGKSDD
jgi:hypothetical protein